MAFNQDGTSFLEASSYFGSLGGEVRIWDVTRGESLGPTVQPHGENSVTQVAWSQNGKSALTAGWDRTARLWDAATGKLRVDPLVHQDQVVVATFGPEEKTILTASGDRTARLWDAATGRPRSQPLLHADRMHTARLSPDGGTILTLSEDGNVRIWTVPPDYSLGPALAHPAEVGYITFSGDGRIVLTSTFDKRNPNSPRCEARLWDPVTRQLRLGPLPTGPIWRSAITPDGRTLLTGTLLTDGKDGTVLTDGKDGTVRLWDTITGQPRGQPIALGGRFVEAAFHPDGKSFVTRALIETSKESFYEGRLWETATGQPLGRLFTASWLHGLEFHPNGKEIFVQEAKDRVRTWDLTSREPRDPTFRQNTLIWSLALHPDGKTLLTGGFDGIVRLWDVASDRPLDELHVAQDPVRFVAFSPDRRSFLTTPIDVVGWHRRAEDQRLPKGTAQIWDLATRLPLGAAL